MSEEQDGEYKVKERQKFDKFIHVELNGQMIILESIDKSDTDWSHQITSGSIVFFHSFFFELELVKVVMAYL